MKKIIGETSGEKMFRIFSGIFLVILSLTVVLPFMHIVSISVSNSTAVIAQKVTIYPIGFNLRPYKELLTSKLFLSSLINTVFLTVVTTVLGLIVNTCTAYALSKEFCGKKFVTYFFVVTMYFSGGLIPTYLLISNTLNLYNNYLAFILPSIVSVFYTIVIRSQIESIPPSLAEAAEIDGANQYHILIQIILPSIKPTLAAIGMFLALGMWNMWYNVLLYTNRESMWNLQYLLRTIVFEKMVEPQYGSGAAAMNGAFASGEDMVDPYNYQMAAIVATALPIVCIYPFVQKYFVKGILTGAVKE